MLPLQTVCGWTGGDGAGVHAKLGGTLTGEGAGKVTLGPELPPRWVQMEPSHVQVWS